MENSLCRIYPPKNINRLELKRGICPPPPTLVPALKPVQPTVQVGTELRGSVLKTVDFGECWILDGSDLVGLPIFTKGKGNIDLANNSALTLCSNWFQSALLNFSVFPRCKWHCQLIYKDGLCLTMEMWPVLLPSAMCWDQSWGAGVGSTPQTVLGRGVSCPCKDFFFFPNPAFLI